MTDFWIAIIYELALDLNIWFIKFWYGLDVC